MRIHVNRGLWGSPTVLGLPQSIFIMLMIFCFAITIAIIIAELTLLQVVMFLFLFFTALIVVLRALQNFIANDLFKFSITFKSINNLGNLSHPLYGAVYRVELEDTKSQKETVHIQSLANLKKVMNKHQ